MNAFGVKNAPARSTRCDGPSEVKVGWVNDRFIADQ